MNKLNVFEVGATIYRGTLVGTPGMLNLAIQSASEKCDVTVEEVKAFHEAATVAVTALKSHYAMKLSSEAPQCSIQGHVSPELTQRLIGMVCLEVNRHTTPDPEGQLVFATGIIDDCQL